MTMIPKQECHQLFVVILKQNPYGFDSTFGCVVIENIVRTPLIE